MVNPQKSNSLAHPPFDALADIGRYVILRDDFIGGNTTSTTIGDLGWTLAEIAGTPGSDVDLVSTAATVQGHPGVISFNTGATTPAANDEASLYLPNVDSLILPDGTDDHIYAAALVRFPSVTEVEFYFGLFDASAAGRGTNGVCVELDVSADTEFNVVATDGGTSTAVASTITAAADTWYLIELAAHEDEVQAWINGEFAGAVTSANIPDDEGLTPMFKIGTEGTDEKSVLIDAFLLRAAVDRGY